MRLSLPFNCFSARVRLFSVCLVLASSAAKPAEEAPILRITGNLIGSQPVIDAQPPRSLIADYYSLLPEDLQSQATDFQQQLAELLPDYQVAYAAADTAELNGVMAKAGFVWASIRTLHARQFTAEAATSLSRAYGDLFPFIASSRK